MSANATRTVLHEMIDGPWWSTCSYSRRHHTEPVELSYSPQNNSDVSRTQQNTKTLFSDETLTVQWPDSCHHLPNYMSLSCCIGFTKIHCTVESLFRNTVHNSSSLLHLYLKTGQMRLVFFVYMWPKYVWGAALPPLWLAFNHPNHNVCANEHRPAAQMASQALWNGTKCHWSTSATHLDGQGERLP